MARAVVVLGQELTEGEIHDELAGRVETGVERAKATDAPIVVMSGGNPGDGSRAEAAVMARYASGRAVAAERIIEEDRSLDTIGNAYFTRVLLDQRDDIDAVEIVTSDWHADRAEFVFRQTFEPDYDVCSVSHHTTARTVAERRSFARARAFFRPLECGDTAGIRDRLVETHDLYAAADVRMDPVDGHRW